MKETFSKDSAKESRHFYRDSLPPKLYAGVHRDVINWENHRWSFVEGLLGEAIPPQRDGAIGHPVLKLAPWNRILQQRS